MGAIFVGAALLAGACKGFCGKKTSGMVREFGDAVRFNGIRFLFCIFIGLALVLVSGTRWQLTQLDGRILLLGIFAGAANAGFVVSWLLAVRKNAYMTVDVVLTLGSLLPAVLCALIFDEPISGRKLIGFGLILAAVVVMAGYNRSVKSSTTVGGVMLMVLSACAEGLVNFSQQIYKYTCESEYSAAVYNLLGYFFAALTLAILSAALLLRKKAKQAGGDTAVQQTDSTEGGMRKALPYIVLMAACLFANSYFQTLATTAGGMSSQMLYPIMRGGGLILSTLMAAAFFGERITVRSVCGIAVSFLGILFCGVL